MRVIPQKIVWGQSFARRMIFGTWVWSRSPDPDRRTEVRERHSSASLEMLDPDRYWESQVCFREAWDQDWGPCLA